MSVDALKQLTSCMDKPIKRVGLVVLALGAAITLIGLIQLGSDLSNYRWTEKFLNGIGRALRFDRYTYSYYPLACIGPYVLLTGLLFSYLYDRTIGRLLAWIRHG